jgi:hypothetical protein
MQKTVLDFFADLSARRLTLARDRAAPGFAWFGKVLDGADWEGEKLAAYLDSGTLEVSNAREVPQAIIEVLSSGGDGALFDGALSEGDAVVLVDVNRNERTVTAGVVVGLLAGELALRRIFDPALLSAALSSLSA